MLKFPRRRHVRRTVAARRDYVKTIAAAAGAAVLLLLILLLRPSAQLLNAPEIGRSRRLGVLRVGVLSDVPGLSRVQNGEGDGLDIALAHALGREIFPDIEPEVAVELVVVNRYTALTHLKNGDVDIVLAMQVNADSDSFTYSGPYYQDAIRLLCRVSDSGAPLNEKRVGIIEGSEAAAAWKAYEEEHDAALKATYYASYPDMLTALRAGAVDFIAVPGVAAQTLLSQGIAMHETVLGKVGYVGVSSAEQPAFALLLDLVIQRMQKDGSLDALISQYGLG